MHLVVNIMNKMREKCKTIFTARGSHVLYIFNRSEVVGNLNHAVPKLPTKWCHGYRLNMATKVEPDKNFTEYSHARKITISSMI